MSELKYWLGFSKSHTIGSIRLKRLIEHFGSIRQCWHATAADLVEIEGMSPGIIEKFQQEKKKLGTLEKYEEEVSAKGIKIINYTDENYPYYLKQIHDPPVVLFIKGDLNRCDLEKNLAVVGSRGASHYIKEILKKIIRDLRGSGITITSGMALGVDSCAHQAALDNDLPTIAVLGAGLDNIYPKTNKKLFEQIVESGGAVMSEYYHDTRPLPMFFPRRNRIICGLSQGTLVAEAGLKSGALITASLCLEQNRELMCIPGMITNPNTEGTHKLIKEGATVVTEAKDILEHLKWGNSGQNKKITKKNNLNLLDNEKKIYDILSLEPRSFDDLINQTKLSAEELMTTLTTMELTGIITQMPGQNFIKNINYQ